MRARKPRRPGTDDGHAPSGRLGMPEGLLAGAHHHVGRIALQPADLDGLALGGGAHTGFLAQGLGRAHAGAHAAQDILRKDGLSSPLGIAGHDLADEQRNVDGGRAGLHAGRLVAEIAAVALDQRLVRTERRIEIGEVERVGFLRKALCRDIGFGHG